MKKFIAFSGGVESTTMCLLFGNKANAIFADTGAEHKEIDRIDLVERTVREFHGNDFKIIKVKNRHYQSLQDRIIKGSFFPSFKSRFCTYEFKIKPIDDYLSQFEKEGAELMIGLNAEEGNKRTGNLGQLKFVNYAYPLFERGISRRKCIEILKAANMYPEFPPYMRRGGCKFCYYKSKSEYRAMIHLSPDEFQEVVDLEIVFQDEREVFFSIIAAIPEGMEQFRKNELSNFTLFDMADVYATVNDATSCGQFCNR